jgi:hypothetical protein
LRDHLANPPLPQAAPEDVTAEEPLPVTAAPRLE